MVESNMFRSFSVANPTRSAVGAKTLRNFPWTRPSAASEKKGGRRKASVASPALVEAVADVVAEHTAGSPVSDKILWTNRSPREIGKELAVEGFTICAPTVRRILREDLKLGVRQAVKEEPTRSFPQRDDQFEHINERRRWYINRQWPVISIDTKKKEPVGDFFRPGRAYTDGVLRVLDHDFAEDRLVPYGVYDVVRNEALVLLAMGADTSDLACDAVRRWWYRLGRKSYWNAPGLLVLCDCGGGNGNRHYIFKESLQRLATRLNRPIEVAHYPPGCSKYNPIEHQLFCHVTRSLQGVVLKSIYIAQDFISRTTTTTGLHVLAEVAKKVYEKGRHATPIFMKDMPIRFANVLPELNYTALPYKRNRTLIRFHP
jgi:hypothetical protein